MHLRLMGLAVGHVSSYLKSFGNKDLSIFKILYRIQTHREPFDVIQSHGGGTLCVNLLFGLEVVVFKRVYHSLYHFLLTKTILIEIELCLSFHFFVDLQFLNFFVLLSGRIRVNLKIFLLPRYCIK